MTDHHASCSCGQLTLLAHGDPIRVSMCHCLACQRRTGSTYGAQARFATANVEITGTSTEYVRSIKECFISSLADHLFAARMACALSVISRNL